MSAPAKRGRGQPPKPPAARASETIAFRLTPSEAAALDARATAEETRHDVARAIVRRGLV